MTKTSTRGLMLLILGSGALLAGCQPKADDQAEKVAALAPAAAAAPFSVNEMMVMIVDRPGELLWDAEKEGRAPKTADDWYDLENHAVELASAGTLIQMGGTGPSDADWAADPAWKSASQQMISAALSARTAARRHDIEALVKANGEIVEACETCHKQFKPDLPTGNLFMRRGPQPAPAKT